MRPATAARSRFVLLLAAAAASLTCGTTGQPLPIHLLPINEHTLPSGLRVVIEPRVRKGSAFAIGEELTIGRASGCTISIPDDTYISQLHARVFTDTGQVYVEDLGSTNGSLLNGNRLARPTAIHKGDRLQLGSTVLEAE